MTRDDLTLTIAAILLAVFALGWCAHWIVARLTRPSHAEIGDLERMAHELRAAEDARDLAVTTLEEREASLTRALAERDADLESAREVMGQRRYHIEQLEAELAHYRS